MSFTYEERGQTLPLIALLVVSVGITMLVVTRLAGAVTERAQAQTAADGAALAGASEDRSEAERIARSNGARLLDYRGGQDEVWVKVELGDATATARARRVRSIDGSGL